jgi:MFS family permease
MKYFINFSILFRNRNFGLLSLGQFISFMGTMITSVALPYQIYHLTQSTLMVGLLSLSQLLPLLITALLGGVLADRHHRRTMLLLAETFMAIGCLLLAWNAALISPHIWVIFIVASALSAINGLHRPALDSITQQLVSKKDLPTVGAITTFKFSIAMIAGPAIGGLIISHYGIIVTFIVDFATFLISLISLLMMTHIPKPMPAKDESTWAALKSGFKYAMSRQELVGTYVVDFVAMIFGMPNALFPAIAQMYGGAKTLGMLYSAPAVGAVVISFFSGWAANVKRHGAAIAISAALWGVAIIFFGLTKNFWLALFFLAIAGAADGVSGVFRMMMWNETIPNELRGRLSGIEMISYLSGPRLGDTEAGLIAAAFGITASIVSGGVLCVAGVGICCWFLPKFWRYKSEA